VTNIKILHQDFMILIENSNSFISIEYDSIERQKTGIAYVPLYQRFNQPVIIVYSTSNILILY